MATKPTIANARWADTGGADVVAPAGGLRDTGFVAGTPAVQSYVNYLLNQQYAWAQFLDEFFKTAGTATADFKLTGAMAITGLSTQAAITASGLITANAGLTAGANQHVTVSGTGEYKHGDRPRVISPFSGTSISWTGQNPGYMQSGASDQLLVGIDQHAGDRIKSISFLLFGNGAADVTTTVLSLSTAMATTSLGSLVSTNPAASWSIATIDITDTTYAASAGAFIKFDANAAGIQIGTITVIYDHP